jgi:hypothetical protein
MDLKSKTRVEVSDTGKAISSQHSIHYDRKRYSLWPVL